MREQSDIAVFVRVVELGSFTKAADALEISKAAVSKYVNRLEQRLAARLLHRTTRRLALTEAGRRSMAGAPRRSRNYPKRSTMSPSSPASRAACCA